MSGDVQEVATKIEEIVSTRSTVLGSQLSALLKASVPQWSPASFGVRNLREFIDQHVSTVGIAGRSGMDVVYALKEVVPTASKPECRVPGLATQVDLWRVWVSPNSPYALAVDRTGAGLRAVPRGGPVQSDEVLLEPPGVDVHREIGRAFLTSLPVDFQPKLTEVVESANPLWWQAWIRELRGTQHLVPWNAFRHQKLEECLSSALRVVVLDEPAVGALLKTVREQHVPRPSHAQQATRELSQQQDLEIMLRKLVSEAVQHMSIAELRELRLPVGLVLDAFATSRSR